MKRLDIGIALTLGALAACLPVTVSAQETISFPSRSSDLAADSYWTVAEFSEGCCTLDLNVRRWNGDSWTGGGNSENAQNYDWNLPLYAPASGVVISCWRNFPDDPQPGVNPPNNSIFTGGNHVSILTDQGNVISMAHLKSGSVPASLCPRNAGSTQYPGTLDKEGDWRVAAYVAPADRPRVSEGQMIGRVGNSGQSGGPHLHMSIQEVEGLDGLGRERLGDSMPLRFRNSWAHRYEADQNLASASWFRQRGEGTTGDPLCETYQPDSPECGFKHIHASPYLRRADAAAGEIKAGGDVIFLSANRAVTATVADPTDRLKLIAWDLVGVDLWNRKGEIEGDAVKKVVLTQPTADFLLAALHLVSGNLKMVAYHVGAFGTVTEVAEQNAGSIEELEALTVGVDDKKTVTVVRLANGDLKLIAWDVELAADGTASVARLGEHTTGEASHIAVAKARTFGGLYVALRNSSNNLTVIPFSLSSSGLTFTPGGHITSGAAGTEIAVTALGSGVRWRCATPTATCKSRLSPPAATTSAACAAPGSPAR